MKKTYIQPQTTTVQVTSEAQLLHGSWGVDGDHKSVIDGNPDEINAKENGSGLWEEDDLDW